MENMYSLDWNVVSEDEFKDQMYQVFKMVSDTLAKTLGPYGSTTIIEKFGDCHVTKDGWSVLKSIRFKDFTSANILNLIQQISSQVVIRVGDGSTTAIVAANALLEEIDEHTELMESMRSKDFIDRLNKCVTTLVNKLHSNSTKVELENSNDIYKLAYVSTNGNHEISKMIQDIYMQTKNPSIEYMVSKTNETSYEIINGYTGAITYIDKIFVNNKDKGTVEIDSPVILMFDYTVDIDDCKDILQASAIYASRHGKRVIMIAPAYSRSMLEYIQTTVMQEYRQRGESTVIYAKASVINDVYRDMYNDFAIMTGATVVHQQYVDTFDTDNIGQYLGSVNHISIGPKATFISGFDNRNDVLYEAALADAWDKYNTSFEDNKKKSIVDLKLYELKKRYSKLSGSMGVIYVGGNSEIEKVANKDLVDDAVKACESAYIHGYNVGGSLTIPYIIDTEIIYEVTDTISGEIYSMIDNAFIKVFKRIITNKYKSIADEKFNEILSTCMTGDSLTCYDLITNTYSKDIINSCETEIEILKATASIISLLISSNQYISLGTESERH